MPIPLGYRGHQKQFEPSTDVDNPRFSAHIQMKVQRFLDSPTCMDLENRSPSEIPGFIKNLKPNKSPGIDLITNRILKTTQYPKNFIFTENFYACFGGPCH
ncbi:hypothetical protein TNCV_3495421 [Trichonephila clavipes]|nr:hypothetical protein TNCV_3495421 [Trichonephila clavipes]